MGKWLGTLAFLAVAGSARAQAPAERIEQVYDSMRYLRDQLDVTRARGVAASLAGVSVPTLEAAYAEQWRALGAALEAVRSSALGPVDRRAIAAVRQAYDRSPHPDRAQPEESDAAGCQRNPTAWSPPAVATDTIDRLATLQRAIYACYAAAASAIVVEGDTLDRLTILSLLGTTDDPARRERLWRALDAVWSTVNGHGETDSPYARLLPIRRRAWANGSSPMEELSRAAGLTGAEVERWLLRGLEAWRATLPDTLFEPWDVYHFNGAASRALLSKLPRDSLFAVNDRYYRSLGADPPSLNIHYANLPGRVPVAYTTFGATGRMLAGRWARVEPWIFTGYRVGGIDNLNELLHETGHAVHIAAIRARPAFNDWPDSDVFTEAIADLAMLEMFEPAWQATFLGDSVGLAESLRAKYSGIVFDMAWALFEYRVHRPGAPPPNQVWTAITNRYLKVRPHPELSWWAARGQLVNSPGYLSTYALGAFLIADLRRQAGLRFGPATMGNPGWYRGVSASLYRFGLTRPSRRVVEDFLGRPPSPGALLADLARIRRPGRR
jgi:hypothetical protein